MPRKKKSAHNFKIGYHPINFQTIYTSALFISLVQNRFSFGKLHTLFIAFRCRLFFSSLYIEQLKKKTPPIDGIMHLWPGYSGGIFHIVQLIILSKWKVFIFYRKKLLNWIIYLLFAFSEVSCKADSLKLIYWILILSVFFLLMGSPFFLRAGQKSRHQLLD